MRRSTPLLFAAILTAASPPAGAAYRVYVTNEGSGTLSVIDGDTHAVATLPIGKRPRGLTASRDGRHLYVALSGSPASPRVARRRRARSRSAASPKAWP